MPYRAACIIMLLAAFSCPACSPGHDVPGNASRVVSLSPSITRQIVDLGMENVLAGVTDRDTPLKKNVPVIGTIVRPNIELIVSLGPDAVICSEEDGAVQNTSGISAAGIRVVKLPANRDFNGLCDNYIRLGKILGAGQTAERKVSSYRAEHARLLNEDVAVKAKKFPVESKRTVFIVSLSPLMTVSGRSFIGNILRDAGLVNAYEGAAVPYPLISSESLSREDPEIIISMMPGAKDYFKMIFRNVKTRALECGAVFEISPDRVAYYTPADYLAAVVEIRRYAESAGGRSTAGTGKRR